MQTFITNSDFTRIAQCLDNRRLNKQALEAWQIMMVNLNLDPQNNHRISKGWRNHPATLMWRGHEFALTGYIIEMVAEWQRRGFKSTIAEKALATYDYAYEHGLIKSHLLPNWFTDDAVIKQLQSSHRTALLAKEYDYYKRFGWPEDTGTAPDTYEYVWPTQKERI